MKKTVPFWPHTMRSGIQLISMETTYYNQEKKGNVSDLTASLQKDDTIVQSNARPGSERVCKDASQMVIKEGCGV